MEKYLQDLHITNHQIVIGAATVTFVAALKVYFSGGVCKIKGDLTGKTAIVTGGNTGIGR